MSGFDDPFERVREIAATVRKCLALAKRSEFEGEARAATGRAWALISAHDLDPSDFDLPPDCAPFEDDISDHQACFDAAEDAAAYLSANGTPCYRKTARYEVPRAWIVPTRLHPVVTDSMIVDAAIAAGWDETKARKRRLVNGHRV
ncbi:DUF2786 domain-containing protein [Sphingomonas naphthae]|uniref:DUF2786 domain-containing protein n=1 Tax=Sphingomonas naphthae TaxID=1813468 RepID=A0ABY7TFS4_9SPHN|nr:DUF2786 domain-containing protein [Sphingomonas naphthae]WCT72082.1 DUF2786 domain-containing protein [Sphingomonas naphthae]